jgi:hypothetical protein
MTDATPVRTLRERAKALRLKLQLQIQHDPNEALDVGDYPFLPDACIDDIEQELQSVVTERPALRDYVQHKANCDTRCCECGRFEISIYHRDHWNPGSGVFWHDFNPIGKCTCGLDALLADREDA